MASRGFIELLRLADLAKARETGRGGSQGSTEWRGVVFEVAGQKLVAPMGEISEVLSLPEYTNMPMVKSWMLGLANVRGRLLPLTDLAEYLKLESRQPRQSLKKVMVIDHDKLFSGLVVDYVLGIQVFHASQYRAETINDNSPFLRYTHGKFVREDGEWVIFMPSRLAHDKRYSDASTV